MGIIVSIPRIEGLATELSPSSTTSSTSYAFNPVETSTFGVSTDVFDQSCKSYASLLLQNSLQCSQDTESPPIVAVSATQTAGASLGEWTDVILVHGAKSLDSTDTIMMHLSTATVTITTNLTQSIIATATVLASNCLTTTNPTSNTIQSVASTGVYKSRTMGTSTHSNSPVAAWSGLPSSSDLPESGAHIARTSISTLSSQVTIIPSEYGTASYSGQPGSGVLTSQSSFSIFVPRSDKRLASISRIEEPTLSSLLTVISNQKSKVIFPTSNPASVATVQTTNLIRAAPLSHFEPGCLAVGEPGLVYGGPNSTLSSNGPRVDIKCLPTATGRGITQSS